MNNLGGEFGSVAVARKRGKVLGNPRLEQARRVAANVNRTNSPAPPVLAMMRDMRAQGKTWRGIADTLNGSSVRTGRGSRSVTVSFATSELGYCHQKD